LYFLVFSDLSRILSLSLSFISISLMVSESDLQPWIAVPCDLVIDLPIHRSKKSSLNIKATSVVITEKFLALLTEQKNQIYNQITQISSFIFPYSFNLTSLHFHLATSFCPHLVYMISLTSIHFQINLRTYATIVHGIIINNLKELRSHQFQPFSYRNR